jgi:hypothetical protein
MSYPNYVTANGSLNFPLPYKMANVFPFQPLNFADTKMKVGWLDSNYQTTISHLANVANIAVAAFDEANLAANTVAVYANGSLLLLDGNVNFNNTSTMNVYAYATGENQPPEANIEYAVNVTAVVMQAQNSASIYANGSLINPNALINLINTNSLNVNAGVFAIGYTNVGFDVNTTAIVVSAQNTAAVYNNGTLALPNASINFNNTTTINVSTIQNGTGQINVAFLANTSTDWAYGANITAQSAYSLAGSVGSTSTSGTSGAYNQANGAYAQANGAYAQANGAYVQANGAYAGSNIVYAVANSAANTVATFANGVIVLPNANLNFINTTTINVVAAANGTTQSNVGFTVNTTSVYQSAVYTVATLPAATGNLGVRAFVTDSSVITFATLVATGGVNAVPVYCDGTNWYVG